MTPRALPTAPVPFSRASRPLAPPWAASAYDATLDYQADQAPCCFSFSPGTQFEDKTALETLILTSREPHLAATFNYASMAHNNHFFFNGLVCTPLPVTPILPSSSSPY